MNTISTQPNLLPLVATDLVTTRLANPQAPQFDCGNNAAEVREVFTEFVGKTFFSQMLKAMRSTVGKPAYFHGGRAEEVFQSQLDQALVDHIVEASAERFSDPLFQRQFPELAAELEMQSSASQPGSLDQLSQLRRR